MLTTAKSVMSGEPTNDAQEFSAETPGTISTSSPVFGFHPDSASISKINPAIP